MSTVFPEPVRKLPRADIPLSGVSAFLSQSDSHQILFMQFEKDTDVPEHFHCAQYAVVLEGSIELIIDDKKIKYSKGDRYYIPGGVKHSGKIFAGYADITFFDSPDRYRIYVNT